MRRLAALALALLAAGCSDSACQELGERLCACTGLSGDTCTAQVEDQLSSTGINEANCEAALRTCVAPGGGNLCEWLLTEDGKQACGLARKE
jgi:hypothetical protein